MWIKVKNVSQNDYFADKPGHHPTTTMVEAGGNKGEDAGRATPHQMMEPSSKSSPYSFTQSRPGVCGENLWEEPVPTVARSTR